MNVYLIGSLKSDRPREVAEALRSRAGHVVFDQWHASGPDADLHWQRYFQELGYSYTEALTAPFTQNSFQFDKTHLDLCDAAVAVANQERLPGVSSIAELSYVKWFRQKPTFILLDGEPTHWDLMVPLAVDRFCTTLDELVAAL